MACSKYSIFDLQKGKELNQRRRNPVLELGDPAGFSVLPGRKQLSTRQEGPAFPPVAQKTRWDHGPGGLGFDIPELNRKIIHKHWRLFFVHKEKQLSQSDGEDHAHTHTLDTLNSHDSWSTVQL